jgi:hypothetical protein
MCDVPLHYRPINPINPFNPINPINPEPGVGHISDFDHDTGVTARTAQINIKPNY